MDNFWNVKPASTLPYWRRNGNLSSITPLTPASSTTVRETRSAHRQRQAAERRKNSMLMPLTGNVWTGKLKLAERRQLLPRFPQALHRRTDTIKLLNMETLQKTKVTISIALVGQAYFTLLAVAVLPIMLGPTAALMAVGLVSSFRDTRVRLSILPSCPPESYACQRFIRPATTTPETNTPGSEMPGFTDTGGSPSGNNGNASGSVPPIQDQGTSSGPNNGGVGGNDTSGESPTGDGGGAPGADQGSSWIMVTTSLSAIISESIKNGDTQPISPKPTKIQCDAIVRGDFHINGRVHLENDSDWDGLAQQPKTADMEALLQEDYYGTDPSNPDTDYDSYYDGEEACTGNDPLHPLDIKNIDWNLVNQLKGKIVIQTERHGEAWYIYPKDRWRYYLRNGEVAYTIMRYLGEGITDADLAKIPVGMEPRFKDVDSDNDALSDKMEEGLKTDPTKADTDGDGVSDGDEILKNNTNPLGPGVMAYSKKITDRSRGKILLQVQSRGEAWYVNPVDDKRYYMKNGVAAYQIMRFLSLGITNAHINTMPIGTLRGKMK